MIREGRKEEKNVSSWLAEVVRSEGGRVSFERFMELALYHPLHGYY